MHRARESVPASSNTMTLLLTESVNWCEIHMRAIALRTKYIYFFNQSIIYFIIYCIYIYFFFFQSVSVLKSHMYATSKCVYMYIWYFNYNFNIYNISLSLSLVDLFRGRNVLWRGILSSKEMATLFPFPRRNQDHGWRVRNFFSSPRNATSTREDKEGVLQ